MLTKVRIGICECTTFYHGAFEGKTTVFNHLGGKRLQTSTELRFEELVFPQRETQFLYDKRLHFSLDVHELSDVLTILIMYESPCRTIHYGGPCKLAIASAEEDDPRFPRPSLIANWRTVGEPPSANEVLDTMRSFIERFAARNGKQKIDEWISVMDPAAPTYEIPGKKSHQTTGEVHSLFPVRKGFRLVSMD